MAILILYRIIAVLMIALPLFGLIHAIVGGDYFDYFMAYFTPAMMVIFYCIWLISIVAGFLSFLFWWKRSNDIKAISMGKNQFVATSALSHFLRTLGEWIGSYVAIVGFLIIFVSWVVLGDDLDNMTTKFGFHATASNMIAYPILGFLTVLVFRWISEMLQALVVIADNIKEKQ